MSVITVLYKRHFLDDLRWVGFGCIPWEREVNCLPGSIGKNVIAEEAHHSHWNYQGVLSQQWKIWSKIVFGFDGAGAIFGAHGPCVHSSCRRCGMESSIRAAEPSPAPHCWSAQESRRLSCLLGNTSEIRKREIYEVPQKTAKIAKKNLEYLAAKKVSLIRCF